MLVFLDFEASSLGKKSYPIEVAWVFQDGRSEEYLIRPAPDWTEWDAEAEAIHHIPHALLLTDGIPHDVVARRMVEVLAEHDLLASAPSWDGKWLSTLLRAAGLPRHSLRLRDSDDAHYECAATILRPFVAAEQLDASVRNLLALTEVRSAEQPPAHRALPDALEERERWLAVGEAARAFVRHGTKGG
ncbi:MAG: transcriptional regulator [Sphingobium sp.]|uniref:3'-5' exonuclease n=1 Tax=Sphingobium sp. TaxID=1912891 RepID=UPI0029BAEB8D|nr:transcriptional regulator [Sphingobium sp.]MDX3909770.1 transcriptional regulator [Sphingobium sp.]